MSVMGDLGTRRQDPLHADAVLAPTAEECRIRGVPMGLLA